MRLRAFDTETALIAPGRLAPPMACLTWADESGAGIDNPDVGVQRLRDWLRDPDTYIVGANVAFDLGVLAQADPSMLPLIFSALDEDRIGCTQVLSQLHYIAGIQNAPQHGLGPMAKKWLDQDLQGKHGGPDAWRMHYRKLIGLDVKTWPSAARDYAITDAITTRDVWKAMAREMVPDLHPQVRASWALQVMGAWGFRVDPAAVEALDYKIRPPVEAVLAELKKTGLYRPDGSQNRGKLIEMITEAYGGNPPRGEPTEKMLAKGQVLGNVQYSEVVLRESGHPDLMKLAAVSKDIKEMASFLPMLQEGARSGLPVCPRWNTLVRSGRTSCKAPNAQNLPRRSGVRECVVPRDGNLFFGADYSSAEMGTLAQVLYNEVGPNTMLTAFNPSERYPNGQDLHVLTASQIMGIEYDDAYARYTAKDPEVAEIRQMAKAANFGYPGGLGAETFVEYAKDGYGVEISVERARDLKRLWLQTYPEMRGYFDRVSSATRAGLATFIQPFSGRLRSHTGYCDGCNTKFQGLAADGAKRALYEVTRRQLVDRSSPLYGSRNIAFIHDEIIAECPADQAPEAGDELAKVMVEQMGVVAPDVHHAAEPYLMRRWTKGAKTHRDANGRLCLPEYAA